MPDPIFSDLYQDTEDLIWAPTEQVRRQSSAHPLDAYRPGLTVVVAVASWPPVRCIWPSSGRRTATGAPCDSHPRRRRR